MLRVRYPFGFRTARRRPKEGIEDTRLMAGRMYKMSDGITVDRSSCSNLNRRQHEIINALRIVGLDLRRGPSRRYLSTPARRRQCRRIRPFPRTARRVQARFRLLPRQLPTDRTVHPDPQLREQEFRRRHLPILIHDRERHRGPRTGNRGRGRSRRVLVYRRRRSSVFDNVHGRRERVPSARGSSADTAADPAGNRRVVAAERRGGSERRVQRREL